MFITYVEGFMNDTLEAVYRTIGGRLCHSRRGICHNTRMYMTYLEGFMTLQKRYMGRYGGVYVTSEGVFDTIGGCL